MQRNSLSLFVVVLLIADAVSEQSPQKKSFDFQKFIGLLNSPYTLPIEMVLPGGLLPRIAEVIISEKPSKSQLKPLPIWEIKGRLVTPDEGCGFSNVTNTKIIGGQEAKQGAWPWMALLGYRVNSSRVAFRCGGSLITSRHVLTAAHCLHPELSFVRLGEHNFNIESDGPHQDVKVVRTEKHNYNELDNKNDIAILYLERDVNFTDHIRPICLPITEPIRHESFVNSNPFVAGWGYPEEEGDLTPVLHQLQLSVLENNVCTDAFNLMGYLVSPNQFSSGVLCVGNATSGRNSCYGDSGGPLMLAHFENGKFPFYQIGIVSYSVFCGRGNIPSAYTNVAFYADWILEKLKIEYLY